MEMINRSAVILRPKPPMLTWMKIDDKCSLAEDVYSDLNQTPTIYLLPYWESEEELGIVLNHCWSMLFETMLNGWVTEPDLWPQNRTRKMFEEWFTIETYAIVEDFFYQDDEMDRAE